VVPGQPVAEFMSLDSLYVSAPIDERDVGRVAVGQPVRVTVDAHPGRTWEARVSRLASVVDVTREQNRTVEVEVDVTPRPGDPLLRPGLTADVEIVLERSAAVLRVPSAAVMEGRRVLTVERGRAVERAVTIGLKSWEWTEVRSGLVEGETVVITLERPGLRAGVAVKTAGAAAPDSAGAAR
jgi:HlyD family secretion protein